MRHAAALNPGRVVAFRVRYELAGDTYAIALGVAFPNEPGKLGRFRRARPEIVDQVAIREPHCSREYQLKLRTRLRSLARQFR
jgi:hypothetical protein